uniref:Uncharacterized protein n=1 Tax=viral metagenome TaxID=1070528 RepID=A0A6C0M120_9ZZZZ
MYVHYIYMCCVKYALSLSLRATAMQYDHDRDFTEPTYMAYDAQYAAHCAMNAMDAGKSVSATFPDEMCGGIDVTYRIQRDGAEVETVREVDKNGDVRDVVKFSGTASTYIAVHYSPMAAEDYYKVCGKRASYDEMLCLLTHATSVVVKPYYVRKVLR